MRTKSLSLAAVFFTASLAYGQGFTIDLPVDAVLIKLNKGFDNMVLPIKGAQGPAMNGIIYEETDKETSQINLHLYNRPREVTVSQIKENGYLFVRYFVPFKDLNKYFTFDNSKVMHTAPNLAADFYCIVSKGVINNDSVTLNLNGLSAGQYWSYCHARALRGAKFGFFDFLKAMSGDLRISPSEYEKEMAGYWSKSDPDEFVIVDVIADVLPTNDKVIVEGVHSRVWGLVDDSYKPYTEARAGVRIAGLNLVSDPQSGMPSIGSYLQKCSQSFKSNGTIEKIFMDGVKASMGPYVHLQQPASTPQPTAEPATAAQGGK